MKVVIIYASPRKKGVTSQILFEIGKNISPKHSVESFYINHLQIKPCISCLRCRPDKKCVLPYDDAHMLSDKIIQSDVIIFGSPVYWGNMPGSLKMFFDRSVTTFESAEAKPMKLPRPLLKYKKAIIITSSASPFPYNQLSSQSRGTINAFKTILNAGGIKIQKILNIPNSYKFEDRKIKYFTKAKNIALSIDKF